MSSTTRLGFDDFDPGSSGTIAFNKAIRISDGLIHVSVRTNTVNNPTSLSPGPSPGEVFIVGASGAGGWAGHSNEIAIAKETVDPDDSDTFDDPTDWEFVTVSEGFIVWLQTLGGHRLTYIAAWSTPISIADFTTENQADTNTKITSMLDELREHGIIAT